MVCGCELGVVGVVLQFHRHHEQRVIDNRGVSLCGDKGYRGLSDLICVGLIVNRFHDIDGKGHSLFTPHIKAAYVSVEHRSAKRWIFMAV